jgi:hypothetical protein
VDVVRKYFVKHIRLLVEFVSTLFVNIVMVVHVLVLVTVVVIVENKPFQAEKPELPLLGAYKLISQLNFHVGIETSENYFRYQLKMFFPTI